MKRIITKQWKLGICFILLFVFIVTGCGKENTENGAASPTATITVSTQENATSTPTQSIEVSPVVPENPWEGTDGRQLVPKLNETKYPPLVYSFDYYVLPQFYVEHFPPSQISCYYSVIDAYLNYETSITYENESDLDNLWGLLKEDFPLFYSDVIPQTIEVDYQKKEIRWSYSTSSKEEHDVLITEFADKVTGYMDGISERDTDTEKAFIIYLNFIRSIVYDYEAYEASDYSFQKTSAYTALVKGSGVCMSFSKGYAYLLNQVGIDAIDIAGSGTSPDVEGHAWTMMLLNDSWYFADPTWDAGGTNGICYFAFTADDREADGYPFELTTFCSNGDLHVKDYFEVKDTRFEEIREWIWVKDLDRETDELVYVLYPGPSEGEHKFSLR